MESCRRRSDGLHVLSSSASDESSNKCTQEQHQPLINVPPPVAFRRDGDGETPSPPSTPSIGRRRSRWTRGSAASIIAVASASSALILGGRVLYNHAVAKRVLVPIPESCSSPPAAAASSTSSSPPALYHSVPNTLDLFSDNRIICPKQTVEAFQRGNVASTTPDQWQQYREEVQRAGRGWTGQGPGRGLIVFKRGGSGSTWFDSLLHNHPELDFRHEAHRNVFKANHTMDKATQKMTHFLSGDGKCASDFGYCGFSISPTKHAPGADWGQIIRDTGAALVVFVRTNVVKRLLGLERKSLVHSLPKQCRRGSSYKPTMAKVPECAMNRSVVLGPKRIFNGADEASFVQAWELVETALSTGAPFQILSYEAMQQNMTLTFDRLGSFSGWPLKSFDWSDHQTTAKVTSENMKESIANYKEVEQWLQQKPCFLDMLHSEDKQIFPLCNAPRNFSLSDSSVPDVK